MVVSALTSSEERQLTAAGIRNSHGDTSLPGSTGTSISAGASRRARRHRGVRSSSGVGTPRRDPVARRQRAEVRIPSSAPITLPS